MQRAIRKVVVPVAGLGTRGLPFTKEVPKELLPILEKPAIHFIVEEIVKAGIETIVFVTSKGKHALEDYFDRSPDLERTLEERGKEKLAAQIREIGNWVEVISVRQKAPLGLGHAVLCSKPIVGEEPFAVCLGDEIFPLWDQAPSAVGTLCEAWQKNGKSVLGVQKVPPHHVSRYGIVDIGEANLDHGAVPLRHIVEKPAPEKAPSQWAVVGRYVFSPQIFECLEGLAADRGSEIQLTDGIARLQSREGVAVAALPGARFDVGNPISYLQAQVAAALRQTDLASEVRQNLAKLL